MVGSRHPFDWNMLRQPAEYPLTSYQVSERPEILEWISTIPYKSHHMRIRDNRLEGTAEWILDKKEYQNWISSSESMMLLLRGTRKSLHSFITG